MSGEEQILRAVGKLEGRMEAIASDVAQLKQDIGEVKSQANRWKGAFGFVLIFGGIFGFIGNFLMSLLNSGSSGP